MNRNIALDIVSVWYFVNGCQWLTRPLQYIHGKQWFIIVPLVILIKIRKHIYILGSHIYIVMSNDDNKSYFIFSLFSSITLTQTNMKYNFKLNLKNWFNDLFDCHRTWQVHSHLSYIFMDFSFTLIIRYIFGLFINHCTKWKFSILMTLLDVWGSLV